MVRSIWEANIALFFDFLKERGLIRKWTYEPKRFEFFENLQNGENYKRGPYSYLPDFYVEWTEGECEWIEVKGRKLPGDPTRMSRFKKHFPKEYMRHRIIGTDEYRKIAKLYSRAVKGWQE